MVRLTRRQDEFIRTLLDLYREVRGPIHYTELAERLGVNSFTAYDMLRVLEEKGLVRSEYRLDEGREGPGRSTVVHVPTEQAHRLVANFIDRASENWEADKEHLLQQVHRGEANHGGFAGEVFDEVLARIPPEEADDVRYCLEVMTVVALRMRRSRGRKKLLEYLPHILRGKPCRPELSLLGGFALGILVNEDGGDAQWEGELLEHIRRYETMASDMDSAACRRLAKRISEVFALLETE